VSTQKGGATPGPWVVVKGELAAYPHVYRPERTGDDGLKYWAERICVVYPNDADDDRVYHPIALANAHLIASAPELLALAKRYASECGTCDGKGFCIEPIDHEEIDCNDCADIRLVIEKAEGRE
jgi:hypothetical protein